MLKADEFCRIIRFTEMSFVEFCRGIVGFGEICRKDYSERAKFVEICFNLSLIVDEMCRRLTNDIKIMSKGVD